MTDTGQTFPKTWPSPLERFEEYHMPEPNSGCWLWIAAVRGRPDYGTFSVNNKQVRAHRWAYEHFIGPVPDGLVLDHLCKVSTCVNPWHLEPVTNRENLMRGTNRAAQNARKMHCARGHRLSGDRVTVNDKGHRVCLECHKIKNKTYREKRRRLAEAGKLAARSASIPHRGTVNEQDAVR